MHNFPSWQQICSEYSCARVNLEQLVKEGGGIGAQSEQLILNLDAHFNALERRVNSTLPIIRSMTPPLPPVVNRKGLKGMVAYRAWEMKVKGALSPAISWSEDTWKSEVSFADATPELSNRHGLHANRVECWKSNGYDNFNFTSGLIDAHGRIIEHADGVIRAECARILAIILEVRRDEEVIFLITGAYESLHLRYPNIPIYILSPYQKELYLWREVLISYGAV